MAEGVMRTNAEKLILKRKSRFESNRIDVMTKNNYQEFRHNIYFIFNWEGKNEKT
jgi:hypothetical protein